MHGLPPMFRSYNDPSRKSQNLSHRWLDAILLGSHTVRNQAAIRLLPCDRQNRSTWLQQGRVTAHIGKHWHVWPDYVFGLALLVRDADYAPSPVCETVPTVALVMMPSGLTSQGRWPSPVPRNSSGKIRSSTAWIFPSVPRTPPEATKSTGLTSVSLRFSAPKIFASGVNVTDCFWPSGRATVSV